MNSRRGQLRLADYVEHILGACERIQEYMQGATKDAFFRDQRTQDAIIRNILVVGEAAAQILDNHAAFAQAQSEIPWNQMEGAAQPNGPWKFRDQSGARLGDRPSLCS